MYCTVPRPFSGFYSLGGIPISRQFSFPMWWHEKGKQKLDEAFVTHWFDPTRLASFWLPTLPHVTSPPLNKFWYKRHKLWAGVELTRYVEWRIDGNLSLTLVVLDVNMVRENTQRSASIGDFGMAAYCFYFLRSLFPVALKQSQNLRAVRYCSEIIELFWLSDGGEPALSCHWCLCLVSMRGISN